MTTGVDEAARAYLVLINRIRRTLRQQGYLLRKSKVRDVQATDHGKYHITDLQQTLVAGGRTRADYSLTLNDVMAFSVRRLSQPKTKTIPQAGSGPDAVGRCVRRASVECYDA